MRENMQTMLSISTTRRTFLGTAASFAAGAVMPRSVQGALAASPNSFFTAVPIGSTSTSHRNEIESAEDTLRALIEDGLSEVEMMDGPIRSFAGIPGGGRRGAGQQPPAPTDAE